MALMEICLLVDLGLSDMEIIHCTNAIRRTSVGQGSDLLG
jgi:hypothetical protein